MEYIAKTNPRIDLVEHLNRVADTAYMMANMASDNNDLKIASYITGLLHDLGKCTKNFQNHLETGSEEYDEHNVMSYYFINKLVKKLEINTVDYKKYIEQVILYHHPLKNCEGKKVDINYLEETDIDNAYVLLNKLLSDAKSKFTGIDFKLDINYDSDELSSTITTISCPDFFKRIDADKYSFIRCILTPSDVMSSHYEKDNSSSIEDYFKKEMTRTYTGDVVFSKPVGYDSRFNNQLDIVKKLIGSNYPIHQFESQTGFGKTMLGVMYLLMDTKKRGYWVCPQNSIAESIYYSVVKEVKNLGYGDKIEVGLLLSGKFSHGSEKSDIIVTNIDNIFRPVMRSKSGTLYRTYQLLYGNIIFDEYHEYISNSAIMAAFDMLCKTRKNYCDKNNEQSRMLLMSATPSKYFTDDYFGSAPADANIYFKHSALLNRKFHLVLQDKFTEDLTNRNYCMFTNSVKYAQNIRRAKLVDNIITAKFLPLKKTKKYEELSKSHGKESPDNSSWVATSVASTGLDISFKNGVFSKPTPDRTTQGMGRINRWFEYDDLSNIVLVKNQKEISEKYVLNIMSGKKYKKCKVKYGFNEISKSYFEFIKSKFGVDSIITFEDWYDARKEFYELNWSEIMSFYDMLLRESYINLSKIEYLYERAPETATEDITRISTKSNLRNSDSDCGKFFVKLKDSKYRKETDPFIDEVYQMDEYLLDECDDPFWYKALDNSSLSSRTKSSCSRNTTKIKKKLMSLARSSETPIMITLNYFNDEDLGIIEI